MKYNLLQVFSEMSTDIGVQTPENLAKVIRNKLFSKFFPLSNTGLHSDIIRQEAAAKKYGLKPRYGRTLFVKESSADLRSAKANLSTFPVTIYAINQDGRDWLYKAPPHFSDRNEMLNALEESPQGSVMVFIDPAWLKEKEIIDILESHLGKNLIISINTFIYSHDDFDLNGKRYVCHKPVCGAYGGDVKKITFKHLMQQKQNRHPMSLFFLPNSKKDELLTSDHTALEEKAKKSVATKIQHIRRNGESLVMDDLFSLCDEMETVEEKLSQHKKERESVTLETAINTNVIDKGFTNPSLLISTENNLVSIKKIILARLNKFLASHSFSASEISEYNSRLNYEFELITDNGHAAFIKEAIEVASAVSTLSHPIYLRGRGANSFILHLLGLTLIDPVLNKLEPELIFAWSVAPALHFDGVRECDGPKILAYFKNKLVSVGGCVRDKREGPVSILKCLLKKTNDRELIRKEIKTYKENNHEYFNVKSEEGFLLYLNEFYDFPEIDEALEVKENVKFVDDDGYTFYQLSMPNYTISPVTDSGGVGLTSKELDSLGLGSFQILGLNTLKTQRDVVGTTKISFKRFCEVPLKDETKKTENLFNSGLTVGVFMADGDKIRQLFKSMHGGGYQAVAETISLYRYTRLKADFVESQQQKEMISCNYEPLNDLLFRTNGVLLYDNQLVQILKRLFNFNRHEILKVYNLVVKGELVDLHEVKSNLDKNAVKAVEDAFKQSGKFMFCEAHALTYAAYSYRQAYLLAHYPKSATGPLINEILTTHRYNYTGYEKLDLLILMSKVYGVEFGGIEDNTDFRRLQFLNVDGVLVPKRNLEPVSSWKMKELSKKMRNQG